jgi:hypothetical protein
MSKLVFYSSKDTHGKKDATGAFVPEAKAFARYHVIPDKDVIGIDCTKTNKASNRRAKVIQELLLREDLELLAFFGHGWPSGIQFGIRKGHIRRILDHVRATDDLKVGLYACLTAENEERDTSLKNVGPGTDGGFADTFRDEMVRHGITKGWVDGHKTAGHATWNPNLVRFLCEDVDDRDYGAEGGFYLVEPRSTYWKKWCMALSRNTQNLRYSFILKSELVLKSELDRM